MLKTSFSNNIQNRIGVVIAGSAGGGIQSAAKLLASAGILSGLSVSMKGEYPITVGTGFSMAEVILSRNKIYYTGLEIPEVLIVLSEDGMKKVKNRIRKHTIVILDASVESLELASNKVIIQNFTGMGGKKGAALAAIAYWIDTFGGLDKQALEQVTVRSKHSHKLMEVIANSGSHHLVN